MKAPTIYYGPLRSRAQAMRWAATLEREGGQRERDCASILRRNWRMIACRPSWSEDAFGLVKAAARRQGARAW